MRGSDLHHQRERWSRREGDLAAATARKAGIECMVLMIADASQDEVRRTRPAHPDKPFPRRHVEPDGSPYTQSGERVARLAASGIRLVIDEFRTDVTKIRKDGTRGGLRVDYGDSREIERPVAWLWRFVDGARSAGELYGRALVVICAEQYASRLVVPNSQRAPACG